MLMFGVFHLLRNCLLVKDFTFYRGCKSLDVVQFEHGRIDHCHNTDAFCLLCTSSSCTFFYVYMPHFCD